MARTLFPGSPTPNGKWVFNGNYEQMFKAYLCQLSTRKANYAISIEEIKRRKTKSQRNFYWMRMDYLEKCTGYRKADLHDVFMQNCGFGDYIKMPGPNRTPIEKFFRWSSEDLEIKQYGKLIEQQDIFVEFFNEDREPATWIVLPKSDKE